MDSLGPDEAIRRRLANRPERKLLWKNKRKTYKKHF